LLNSRPNAFASSVLDYCLPDEHRFYALACFFSGDAGIHVAGMTEQGRKEGVLNDLCELIGVPRSQIDSQFLEYIECLWHMDPIIQGCSGVIYGPGHFCTFAPPRVFADTPDSKIHFVGTDVSGVYPGYMEGAAQTGKEMGLRLARKFQ
jgi:monoamine oxidase